MSVTAIQFTCSLDNIKNNAFTLNNNYSFKGNTLHGTFTLNKKEKEDTVYFKIKGNCVKKRYGYKIYIKYLKPIGSMKFSKTRCFKQDFMNTSIFNNEYVLWTEQWEQIQSAGRIIISIQYKEYEDKTESEIYEEKQLQQEVARQRQLDPSYIGLKDIKDEINSWSEAYKAKRKKENMQGELESM